MDQWAFSLSSRVGIHLSDHYFSYLHIKVGSECRFVLGNDSLWILWRGMDGKGSSDDDAVVVATGEYGVALNSKGFDQY